MRLFPLERVGAAHEYGFAHSPSTSRSAVGFFKNRPQRGMASKILCGHPAQKKQFLQPFRQPKPRIEQIAHGKRGSPGKRVRKSAVRDSRFLIVVTIGKFAARLDVNSCHYADARLLQTAG